MSKLIYHEKSDFICDYGCGRIAHYQKPKTTPKSREIWQCDTHYNKCPEKRSQREETCLARYGSTSSMHIARENFRQETGLENPSHSKSILEKKRNTFQERYGVDAPLQVEEFRLKGEETCRRNNGAKNVWQYKDGRDRYLKTMIERHGVESPLHSEEIHSRLVSTNLERYGVERPLSNKDILAKMVNTAKENGTWNGCISKGEIEWLNSLGITEENRQIPISGSIVDGFDPETGTIYEFNGDFWHGNPDIFNPHEINPRTKCTFGELHERTLIRQQKLEEAGYRVISIWESEWNKTK